MRIYPVEDCFSGAVRLEAGALPPPCGLSSERLVKGSGKAGIRPMDVTEAFTLCPIASQENAFTNSS
jgi:hypothetical protein